MMTKSGSWLVICTLVVSSLWAAPVEAEAEPESCFEDWSACMGWANSEPVDWIQDYKRDYCNGAYGACAGPTGCGDTFCDTYHDWENHQYCPSDCP